MRDRRVGYVLKRVQAALRAQTDAALERYGVTTPQYAALSALDHEPGLSSAELARRSFVTPQTMIKIVENLEEAGLLTREQHPSHGRVLQAVLTSKGRRVVAACHASMGKVEARMLGRIRTSERSQLLDMLERCAEALDDRAPE